MPGPSFPTQEADFFLPPATVIGVHWGGPGGTRSPTGVPGYRWANWFPCPLAIVRSRFKRQNLTWSQVSCAKSLRTIFVSELLKFDHQGWKLWEVIAGTNRNCFPKPSVRALCLQLLYPDLTFSAPCSFWLPMALLTLPKHKVQSLKLEPPKASVENLLNARPPRALHLFNSYTGQFDHN